MSVSTEQKNDLPGHTLAGIHKSRITVGIICALPVELRAVQAIFDELYGPLLGRAGPDRNIYTCGRIGQHNVAIAQLGRYGLVSAAEAATHMVHTFSPPLEINLLVGIAGGIPLTHHDIRLGDVVVCQPDREFGGVVQYDLGRKLSDGTLERVRQIDSPSALLLGCLNTLLADQSSLRQRVASVISHAQPSLARDSRTWTRPSDDLLFVSTDRHTGGTQSCAECDPGAQIQRQSRSQDCPELHCGTIASGNQVIKDGLERDRIGDETGALCFEMEAAGISHALPSLVLRGICDYADSHKNSAWQPYASLAAAAFAKEVVSAMPVPASPSASIAICNDAVQVNHEQLELERKLENIRLQAERDTLSRWSSERSQLIQIFRTSNYYESKNLVATAAPNTCKWTLNHSLYLDWTACTESTILWISADPGCGKSVLMKTIVDSHLSSKSTHTICFYFFRESSNHGRLSEAFCALIHQLLEQHPYLAAHLPDGLAQQQHQVLQDSHQLSSLLCTLWEHAKVEKISIFIDALDECIKEEFAKLIQWIADWKDGLHAWNGPIVRFLLASRPEDYITFAFRAVKQSKELRIRGENENEILKEEIEGVLTSRISALVDHHELSIEASENILKRLLGMQNRTYLWIDLVFRDISDTLHVSGSLDDLNLIPDSVQSAYEKILRRLPKAWQFRAFEIFKLMVAAESSLKTWEIQIALQLLNRKCSSLRHAAKGEPSLEQVKKNICQWCGHMIFIQDNELFFIHQTVKEFLVSSSTLHASEKEFLQFGRRFRHQESVVDLHEALGDNARVRSDQWAYSIHLRKAYQTLCNFYVSYLELADLPIIVASQQVELWRNLERRVEFEGVFPFTTPTPEFDLLVRAANNWTWMFSLAQPHWDTYALSKVSKLYTRRDRLSKLWRWLAASPNRDTRYRINSERKLLVLQTPSFFAAVLYGHYQLLQYLLSQGPDLASQILGLRDSDGHTLLHYTCLPPFKDYPSHRTRIARLLIDAGLSCDVKAVDGRTALHVAGEFQHVRIAELLLDNRADPNEVDSDDLTPILCSLSSGDDDADFRASEPYFQFPEAGVPELYSLLRTHGARVNAKDYHGIEYFKMLFRKECPKDPSGFFDIIRGYSSAITKLHFSDSDVTYTIALACENGWAFSTPLLDSVSLSRLHVIERSILLRAAAETGQIPLCLQLLDQSSSLQSTYSDDVHTLLCVASRKGHAPLVRSLISHRPTSEIRIESLCTALENAIGSRSIESTKAILDILPQSALPRDSVYVACSSHGNEFEFKHAPPLEILSALLIRGADPNFRAKNRSSLTETRLAIVEKAKQGHEDAIRLLLHHQADPNMSDSEGNRALHQAVMSGQMNIIRLLLEHGADPNAITAKYGSPIACALRNEEQAFEKMLEVLQQYGAKIQTSHTEPCAQEAYTGAAMGNLQALERLHAAGAHIVGNCGPYGGPLHAAAQRGQLDILRYLLEQGCPVDLDGPEGGPLCLWAGYGYESISHAGTLDILFDAGANIEYRSQAGTPLALACNCGCYRKARMLLNRGAKLHGISPFGDALHVAVRYRASSELIDLLLEHGAGVDALGPIGSPMHSALSGNVGDHVIQLLDRGADVDVMCPILGTPLRYLIHKAEWAAIQLQTLNDDYPCVWHNDLAFRPDDFISLCKVAKMLLDAGADAFMEGPHGSAYELAKKMESEQTVELRALILKHCDDIRPSIEDSSMQSGFFTKIVEPLTDLDFFWT